MDRLLGDLERQTGSILTQAGVAPEDVQLRRFAECRYVGQAYEVQVTLPDGPLKAAGAERLATAFEDRYRELYGRVLPGGVVEALTWRVQALGPAIAKGFRLERPERGGSSRHGERDAYFTGVEFLPCAVHDRYALRPGDELNGPGFDRGGRDDERGGPRSQSDGRRSVEPGYQPWMSHPASPSGDGRSTKGLRRTRRRRIMGPVRQSTGNGG